MRKFVITLLLLVCAPLFAQVYNPYPGKLVPAGGAGGGATSLDGLSDVTVGTTPPGTCTDNALYLDSDATVPEERLLICNSNTWYPLGDVAAGDYIDKTGRTISVSSAVVIYSSGAGAPSGACTAGRELYLNTTTTDIYRCSATSVWPQIPYYTSGSGAPDSGDCDASGEVGRMYYRTDNTSLASPLYVCGQTGSGTYSWVSGTPTGTANEITVTGNTLSIASTLDLSGKTSTKPSKAGTSLPATCAIGETYIKTDATAANQLYICTSTNTWTAQGGSGSGGGSVLAFFESSGQAQATTRYSSIGVTQVNATEANRQIYLPRAGTLKNLYVRLTANVGGSSDTFVFTVRVNGSDTGLTCTINTGASTCNDTNGAHNASVSAGDLYSVKSVTSATTGTLFPYISVSFE